jgi:ABC-type nitrate/sulfonate/bicarbonate transport system substrate-binding protein
VRFEQTGARLCAVALLVLFASAPAAAQVRLSYSIVGPPVAAVWMAHETGAFKRHGVDAQLVYIPSSVTNIQAILGGSLDVAIPGSSGVVLAAARGAPVVAIAATMNRPPMTLYAQPEVVRTDQLKGQVLGITRLNSTSHTVTTLILRKLGLAQAVTQRPLGGNPEVQGAFEQKQIAGMVTSVRPRTAANALLNAADLEIPFAMNVFATTQEFLQKNPQLVERLLRAYIEGVAALSQDRAGAVRVLAKYLKRNDPAFLDEMHKISVRFTDRVPKIDHRTVATVLEFEPVKGVDADSLTSKVIDNSIVDKLAKEGFIEKAFSKGAR